MRPQMHHSVSTARVLIAVYANSMGHSLPTHNNKRRDSHVSEFHFNCSRSRCEIMMHLFARPRGTLTLGFIHIAFHSHGRALLNNIPASRGSSRLLVIQTPNFRFRKCWPVGRPAAAWPGQCYYAASLSLARARVSLYLRTIFPAA